MTPSNKTMKTVGIIGGLGPTTTTRFYLELIAGCQKISKIHRPPVLIWSVPIAYQDELEEIIDGKFNDNVPLMLIDAAKRLEKGGADFLVMPCNSSHAFIDLIKESINIPILDIIEITINWIKGKNISEIGLITTLVTYRKGLYSNSLLANNINFFMPTEAMQENINKIILNITMARYGDKEKNIILETIKYFRDRQIKNVVLACSALEILLSNTDSTNVYDTMKIYAKATVNEIINRE